MLDDRIKATLYGTGGLVKTTWYAGLYEKTVENSTTKQYYYVNSPEGPIALFIQTDGGVPDKYYICKDHLGSITGILASNTSPVAEFNYDAWGRRRNPTDWSYTNVPAVAYTNRGFTGHEHLDMFNLINMNGRVYDSEIARFISPDPIIQDPYNIISYNRYSYCLNNPLKYIDPSGYSYKKTMDFWYGEGNYWYRGQAPGAWGDGGSSYGGRGGGGYGGPGCGVNGTGLNGVYYDWYSSTYRSTAEGNPGVSWGYARSIASQYGTSYKYGNIGGYVSSNGNAGYVRGLYSNERGVKPIVLDYDPRAHEAVDWYVSLGSWSLGIPAGGGGSDWVNTVNYINTGTGVGSGFFAGNYGLTANQTFRYAQRINGRVVSAAELIAVHTAQSMKVAYALGRINIVTGVLGTGYSASKVYTDWQQGGWENVNGWDVADAGVGAGGLVVSGLVAFGLVSNPVGWAVGIGTGIYFGVRLIHDLSR